MRASAPEYAPLLGAERQVAGGDSGANFYNDGPRARRDGWWTVAWASYMTLMVVGGVVLFATGAKDFWSKVSPDNLMDPASCPIDAPPHRMRRGLLGFGADPDPDVPEPVNFSALLAHPLSAVGSTLAGSMTLGLLFIVGFRKAPAFMVYLALFLQVAIPAALCAVMLAAGAFVAGGILGAICLLLIALFFMWREQIALVSRLLAVSSHTLADNMSLLAVGLTMPVLWGLSLVGAGVLSLGAYTNGEVVPNPSREGLPAKPDDAGLQCHAPDGTPVLCCTWRVDPVAITYLALLGVALTWFTMLLGEIKLFTVAGAVAQWYFIPAVPAASGAVLKAQPPRRRVLRSLGHALGASFGTLCAASALLTLVSYLRQALDAAEKRARDENKVVAIIAMIVVAILRVVLSLVEFLTRFTTVRAAITGEGFIDAAHGSLNLMRRNALDAFGVWWLPPFIVGNCGLMLSVAFGFIVYGASTLVYQEAGPNDRSCTLLGVAAGIVAYIVLSFLAGLLLNILDAVFVCFAWDRDTARVTREDVHVVLKQLPTVGPVVEQPDGGLAYGAPAATSRV